MTELLRALHEEHDGELPIYYLACVPIDDRQRQAELALATTSLGWSSGPVVPIPALRTDAPTLWKTG